MATVNTLGADVLSLRGADEEYHRISRFFRTRAEAQAALASSDWVPTAGVVNVCVTGDEGILLYDADDTVNGMLSNLDGPARAYIDSQLSTLVGDAPDLLNTLSEISDAIGDDPAFITTINDRVTNIENGYDFSGAISAPVDGNVIPFYYANQAAFPSATDAHGAVAHSHADGALFFAHGGTWHQLALNVDLSSNTTTTTALVQTVGVADGNTDLGSFTGSTIADGATVKEALQSLETTLEAVDLDTDDMATLVGLAENVGDLGTFTGSTITDNTDIRGALQELETAVEAEALTSRNAEAAIEDNVSDVNTALGLSVGDQAFSFSEDLIVVELDQSRATDHVGIYTDVTTGGPDATSTLDIKTALERFAANSRIILAAEKHRMDAEDARLDAVVGVNGSNLGTFTGSIISDNTDIKTAVQELEVATELRATIDAPTFTGNVTLGTGAFYNAANERLGLGTTSPGARIHAYDTGGVQAIFQRTGGSSTLTVKNNPADDGITLQSTTQSANALKFEGYGTGSGVRFVTNNNGTYSDRLLIQHTNVTSEVTLNANAGFQLAGVDLTATAAELNYVDGVTSNIQTQLDAKLLAVTAQATLGVDHLITLSGMAEGQNSLGTFDNGVIADNRTIKLACQDLENGIIAKASLSGANFTGNITTTGNITCDSGTLHAQYLTLDNVNVNATAEELNVLDGITATTAELNYVDGVTSNIQTQLDAIQSDVDQNESDADSAIAAVETTVENIGGGVTSTTYSFDTGTAAEPSAKDIRFNNATPGSVTEIYISKTNKAGVDLSNVIPEMLFAGVRIYIQNEGDASQYLAATITSVTEVNATYTLGVNEVSAGSLLSNNAKTAFAVIGKTPLDLGTFTGSTIADNATPKEALQALETAIETTQADVDQNESDADAAIAAVLAGTSIPGPYNNDSDAATGGVAVGAIYKNSNGTIHWRVS